MAHFMPQASPYRQQHSVKVNLLSRNTGLVHIISSPTDCQQMPWSSEASSSSSSVSTQTLHRNSVAWLPLVGLHSILFHCAAALPSDSGKKTHWLLLGSNTMGCVQKHRKEPSVFTHCPPIHSDVSRHSSMSGGQQHKDTSQRDSLHI